MRALDPAFAAHIASGETTLCTCWRLARNDGAILGFTDHDSTLAFGGTTYAPTGGADGGEVAAKLGGAADSSEIVGVLSSAAITEDDIRLGRYAGAEVETWRVNWRDASVRNLLRRDTLGEITREDGFFRAELRSAQQVLNRKQGRLYQSLCGTSLGTSPCGIVLENPAYKTTGSVIGVLGCNRLRITGLASFGADWFAFGTILWTSGARTGLTDRISAQTRDGDGDVVALDAELADWVVPGDAFTAHAGCDRLFSTCKAKFANAINFRGFPHIPGSDFVVKYPKQGDALDGAPYVK